jgi:hypothetical protein
MERLYNAVNPAILAALRLTTRVFGTRLDRPITALEAAGKGLFFDCKMCGNCVLSSTGMSCPMNCPKTIRNGPCGGVRENGHCEVKPEMRCLGGRLGRCIAHGRRRSDPRRSVCLRQSREGQKHLAEVGAQ